MIKKYHFIIYTIIVTIVASFFYWSIVRSGVIPAFEELSISGLKTHLFSLEFKNIFWMLSVPGLMGLILFKQRERYVAFFFKMFRLIFLTLSIPVGIGLWDALPKSTSPFTFLGLYILVLLMLSLVGAFMMTQKEYIFGQYKKDTAWRQPHAHESDTDD